MLKTPVSYRTFNNRLKIIIDSFTKQIEFIAQLLVQRFAPQSKELLCGCTKGSLYLVL